MICYRRSRRVSQRVVPSRTRKHTAELRSQQRPRNGTSTGHQTAPAAYMDGAVDRRGGGSTRRRSGWQPANKTPPGAQAGLSNSDKQASSRLIIINTPLKLAKGTDAVFGRVSRQASSIISLAAGRKQSVRREGVASSPEQSSTVQYIQRNDRVLTAHKSFPVPVRVLVSTCHFLVRVLGGFGDLVRIFFLLLPPRSLILIAPVKFARRIVRISDSKGRPRCCTSAALVPSVLATDWRQQPVVVRPISGTRRLFPGRTVHYCPLLPLRKQHLALGPSPTPCFVRAGAPTIPPPKPIIARPRGARRSDARRRALRPLVCCPFSSHRIVVIIADTRNPLCSTRCRHPLFIETPLTPHPGHHNIRINRKYHVLADPASTPSKTPSLHHRDSPTTSHTVYLPGHAVELA